MGFAYGIKSIFYGYNDIFIDESIVLSDKKLFFELENSFSVIVILIS
jgi:hypothetical protein